MPLPFRLRPGSNALMWRHPKVAAVTEPVIGTPTFRADTEVTPLTRTNMTIAKPAGTVDGDLLVAAITIDNTNAVTAPAGWTLIADTLFSSSTKHVSTYYKVASSEGASWTWTFASTICTGWVGAYSACAPASPLALNTSNPNQANSLTSTATGLTTATANVLLIAVYSNGGGRTYTPAGTMTEQFDSGGGPSLMVADELFATPGATGNRAATLSSAALSGAQLIAFKASGT